MKLSVSNIAWPAEEDAAALDLAAAHGFTGIELAPQKTFGSWAERDLATAPAYRRRLEAMNLRVSALQAILYGTSGCELFRSAETRANLRKHLGRVAALAGELGAEACVFGAPKARDPGTLEADRAWELAVEFLAGVAEMFEAAGTTLAFEANPPAYDCRFVTTTPEACRLVAAVGRPGIRINLDGGTVFLNHEPTEEVRAAVPHAAHFHASEPHLVPLGSTGADHRALAGALAAAGYAGWCSVEMRSQEDWAENLRRASDVMRECYATPA